MLCMALMWTQLLPVQHLALLLFMMHQFSFEGLLPYLPTCGSGGFCRLGVDSGLRPGCLESPSASHNGAQVGIP